MAGQNCPCNLYRREQFRFRETLHCIAKNRIKWWLVTSEPPPPVVGCLIWPSFKSTPINYDWRWSNCILKTCARIVMWHVFVCESTSISLKVCMLVSPSVNPLVTNDNLIKWSKTQPAQTKMTQVKLRKILQLSHSLACQACSFVQLWLDYDEEKLGKVSPMQPKIHARYLFYSRIPVDMVITGPVIQATD